jgi:hypothetical protein
MNNYKALTAWLPFDIRAEALAASLLDNSAGLADSSQVLVRPLGHLNRAGGREVMQVSGAAFNAEGKELVYLDINREGLYDTLPEMLFLHLEADGEDALEKARQLAGQQERARRFFLPFEESFYRARIDLEQAERSALKNLAALLVNMYGLQEVPEAAGRQALQALALALPFISQVAGDLDATASLLTAMLHRQVHITPGGAKPFGIPEALQSRLGEGLLGVDLLLGDAGCDGLRCLQITIGQVLPQEVEDWLPGGKQRRLLEEHLLPGVLAAGEQAEINLEIQDAGEGFALGGQQDHVLSILGYTTHLKS